MLIAFIKHTIKYYKDIVLLGLAGLVIGILVGAVDTAFGLVLAGCTEFRDTHFFWLIPFLPAAGVLIWLLYDRFGKNTAHGMRLVFEVGFGEKYKLPFRMVPLAMVGTWISHIFGGSCGREGVAVQIGAAVSNNVGRIVDRNGTLRDSHKTFLITGMAAGFAGLFQTPLAAVFFALEVLTVGKLEYRALFPATMAALSASYTSRLLGLTNFHTNIVSTLNFHPDFYDPVFLLKLAAMGLIFGFIGSFFALALRYTRLKLGFIFKSPLIKVLVMGTVMVAFMILFHQGRYSGTGENLIELCYSGSSDVIYAYDWILKLALTILTLSSGFMGGEVAPLFSVGSTLGYILAPLFGFSPLLGASLGFAAVFGSASNTLIAAVLVGVETFGFSMLPYFVVVCIISYIFSFNNSIFSAQRTMH